MNVFSSIRNQFRTPRNIENGYELVSKPEGKEKKKKKTARMTIKRSPATLKETVQAPAIPVPQDNSGSQSQANNNTASQPSNNKIGLLNDSIIRFGPFYTKGEGEVLEDKEKVWNCVIESVSVQDPGIGKEKYVAAIKRVEKEVREIYNEKMPGTNSKFRLMMLKDGCFFLQLAFLILRKSSESGKSNQKNEILGRKLKRIDYMKWIESMFLMGNQIPLVFLNELMNQELFKKLSTNNGNVYPDHTSSLYKKVLYELFVTQKSLVFKQKPSDLLHALHIMVVGPASSDKKTVEKENEDDLEANNEEEDDDYQKLYPTDNSGQVNLTEDHKVIFPSAIELKQAGIRIRKLKSGGIRSITFKSYYFFSFLFLPVLPVDDCVDVLFHNLETYDKVYMKQREVSSYLRIMSDMIKTGEDVRLLRHIGIIKGRYEDTERLPRILHQLTSDQDVELTQEFHKLRSNVMDFSSPYKLIISFVAFLTFVQTFFALLAYFKPFK